DQGAGGGGAGPVPAGQCGAKTGRHGGRRQPSGRARRCCGATDLAHRRPGAEVSSLERGHEMTETPRQLLIVEDDESFSRTLRRSFERRGYEVIAAHSHDQMVEVLKTHHPDYAVVDLKLGAASGLTCVQTLHAFDPELVIVVLTGFASIATAVEAIKL